MVLQSIYLFTKQFRCNKCYHMLVVSTAITTLYCMNSYMMCVTREWMSLKEKLSLNNWHEIPVTKSQLHLRKNVGYSIIFNYGTGYPK